MFKGRTRRLMALTGLVVVLASTVALTVASTGAYFTDSQAGSVNGTFGSVKIDMNGSGTGAGNLTFNFDGMMPGAWKTATITATNTGTGAEDIYLAFTNANQVWSQVNTLGTFGEADVNGTNFNNLNNHYPQNTAANPGQVNSCGDAVGPIRYLPHVNFLGTLNPGQSANYTLSFRYSACISNSAAEGAPAFTNPLEFNVAAFQAGVAPSDPHNGAGKIADLTLASGYYQ